MRRVLAIGLGLLVLPLSFLGAGRLLAADVERGKAAYASRCAFCHGMSGKGDGPAGAALKPSPTNFTSADFWNNTTPEAIRGSVENGKPNTGMVGFKASLSPEQIDDLLAYLQALKPPQ